MLNIADLTVLYGPDDWTQNGPRSPARRRVEVHPVSRLVVLSSGAGVHRFAVFESQTYADHQRPRG